MSRRTAIDWPVVVSAKGWLVLISVEDEGGVHCVDVFRRIDGTFGFEHFRRDPEDQGRWTPIGYFSSASYATEAEARAAAVHALPWLAGTRMNECR